MFTGRVGSRTKSMMENIAKDSYTFRSGRQNGFRKFTEGLPWCKHGMDSEDRNNAVCGLFNKACPDLRVLNKCVFPIPGANGQHCIVIQKKILVSGDDQNPRGI